MLVVFEKPHGQLVIIAPAAPGDVKLILANTPGSICVERTALPTDSRLIDAWRLASGCLIVDLVCAKTIAHDIRRRVRSEQMAPLDIESTVPYLALKAEEKRQALRNEHGAIQAAIDIAGCVDDISAQLDRMDRITSTG